MRGRTPRGQMGRNEGGSNVRQSKVNLNKWNGHALYFYWTFGLNCSFFSCCPPQKPIDSGKREGGRFRHQSLVWLLPRSPSALPPAVVYTTGSPPIISSCGDAGATNVKSPFAMAFDTANNFVFIVKSATPTTITRCAANFATGTLSSCVALTGN